MYTIGQMSRLSHVSARLLRHYDWIGLLRPARIDAANGYRYYEADQLLRLSRIKQLQDYGFSLAEVEALLSMAPDELLTALKDRQHQLELEMRHLRWLNGQLAAEIAQMEGMTVTTEPYHVITLTTPAQQVFGLRRVIKVSEIHQLFGELAQEAAVRGLTRSGATQMIFYSEEFDPEHMEVEAQMEVAGSHKDVQHRPAIFCAAVHHKGAYETIGQAYEAICRWLAQQQTYQPAGAIIERFLNDERSAGISKELETGILLPIEKR